MPTTLSEAISTANEGVYTRTPLPRAIVTRSRGFSTSLRSTIVYASLGFLDSSSLLRGGVLSCLTTPRCPTRRRGPRPDSYRLTKSGFICRAEY